MDYKLLYVVVLCGFFSAVRCKDCSYDMPLEMPRSTSVEVVADARSPNPVVTIRYKTDFTLKFASFWLYGPDADSDRGSFITSTSDGDVTMKSTSTADGYELQLFTDRRLEMAYSSIQFQHKCGMFQLYRLINITTDFVEPEQTPTRLLRLPNPEIVIKPYQMLELDVEVESERFQEVDSRIELVRNHTGFYKTSIYGVGRNQDDMPFEVESFATKSPRSRGPRKGFKTTVEIPSGLYDVLIEVSLRAQSFGEVGRNFEQMSYLVNLYSEENRDAKYIIRQCETGMEVVEPYREGDTTVIRYKEGEQSVCLLIYLNGNPLPECALAQMNGDHNVVKLMERAYPFPSAKTFDVHWYTLTELKEHPDYVLALKSGNEYEFSKIRLESYVPLKLEVNERIEVHQPKTVELKCKATGSLKKIGIYEAKYWNAYWSSYDDWQPLKEWPEKNSVSTENYKVDLYMNQTLIDKIVDDYTAIFCAAEGQFGKKVENFRFDFNRTRNDLSDDWY